MKRSLILFFLLSLIVWLAWCGGRFNETNFSLIPAAMCAAECIVLILTAAAIVRRNAEGEADE